MRAVPAVVLHREATPPERDAEVARATGVVGRTVTPFGDYAYYPSGMAIGGICWYRLLPGYAGHRPISLAKAVVQVCDLLDTTAMERPLLAGFGQGAVVALGVGCSGLAGSGGSSPWTRTRPTWAPARRRVGVPERAARPFLASSAPEGRPGWRRARALAERGTARYQLVLGRRRGRGGPRRPGRGRRSWLSGERPR